MMTIQLDTVFWQSLQPWRQTSLLKHVQCHVGMYTEADSAQPADHREQQPPASSLQNHTT